MPFVEGLLKYGNDYFCETGTWKGDTVAIALNGPWKNVRSMEMSETLYQNCVKRFGEHPRVKLFHGNSKTDLVNMIKDIEAPITFWLDSHWSGYPNVLPVPFEEKCPVLYELDQIKAHSIKTHTIIIDDIRLMDGNHFPVFKEQILAKLKEINSDYKIVYYDDWCAKNDVLVAYIEKKEESSLICTQKYMTICRTTKVSPGLADYLRGVITLYGYCKKYNYQLKLDDSHPIFKYLSPHKCFTTTSDREVIHELLSPLPYTIIDVGLETLFSSKKSFTVFTNGFYKTADNELQNFNPIELECKLFLREILTPNEELKTAVDNKLSQLNDTYAVIHLRFGDSALIKGKSDNSLIEFINTKISQLLDDKKDTQFVLLSDSSEIANKLKELNPRLHYWDNNKVHLGYLNNPSGILDTLVDFYILSHAQLIYHSTYSEAVETVGISGFSKISSLIYDIPFFKL